MRGAWTDGFRAAIEGESFSSNPFGSVELSTAWRKGFEDGEKAEGETLGHFRDVVQ